MDYTFASPLRWPVGWPRTDYPMVSRFDYKLSIANARDELVQEIQRLGGSQIVITTNIPARKDGKLYANHSRPKDAGVAVYFNLNGQPKVFACDKWWKVQDNMRAITKTIEAIRGIERWGSSEMLDRIYRGFDALPEQCEDTNAWWSVLGVAPNATAEEIKASYYAKAKEVHPDAGGDAEQFKRLSEAYLQAKDALARDGK